MITFKISLFTSKTLSDGRHPVVLVVNHQRKRIRLSLSYKCLPSQWDKQERKFKRNFEGHAKKNKVLRNILNKAESIWDDIQNEGISYSHDEFKKRFYGTNQNISVFDFIETYTGELEQKGKISTRNTYRSIGNRLRDFIKGKELSFREINYQFLKKFEAWCFENGCTGGGVNFYMRTLRALMNEAIKREILEEKFYPFSTSRNKKGYSLSHLKSEAKPRAMTIEDMEKFKNFEVAKYPKLKDSFNYFLFSYYARGMNFIDMAKLQWKDLSGGRIQYIRSKTKKLMSVGLSEPLKNILEQYPKVEDHDYIFPVLSDFHRTETQIQNRMVKIRRRFNKEIKEIAKIVGIDENITAYVSRHTYATTLNKKDVSITKISQGLGHSDLSTTKAYLKQFKNVEIDKTDELL